MILALFCIGIVYISIIIPINFKVSVEKLRIIMFALFFFPVSIIGIFAEKIIRNLDSIISYIKEFYWNLPIVIIVALAISIYTSINILNKKEY